MAAAEKYVVQYREQAITRPARRKDAHELCHRLGPAYRVWNTVTRQTSV